MKLNLLLLVSSLLMSLHSFSQAEAYPVNDLTQCGFTAFDLTVNSPLALGNQDSAMYSVSYFETEADAQDNTNPIPNTSQYYILPTSPSTTQTIYLRVSNQNSSDFDVTSFEIWYISASVVAFEDMVICGGVFTVPEIDLGDFYTGPGGTGTLLPPGTVISSTTQLYTFNQIGPCTQESAFVITIADEVVAYEPTPLVVCDGNGDGIFQMNLNTKSDEITNNADDIFVSYYTTYNHAVSDQLNIVNPSGYSVYNGLPVTLYCRAENYHTGCYDIVTLQIVEGPCQGNIVTGTVSYDMDNNGCTTQDIPAAGVQVTLNSANQTITTFTAANGNYFFQNVNDGTSTVAVGTGNEYVAAPASATVTFPGNGAGNDFCLSVPNPVNDVAVTLIPMTNAQSGFPSSYRLVLKNNGSLPVSGTVTLQFDNTKIIYNSSSPGMNLSGNTLTYSYTSLQPFQNSYVHVFFTVMVPQIVPAGEILVFTASIDPATGDANPADNVNILEQTVVNALDPNDITVHEGEFITPDKTNEYLHYTIRFQNEGSANAVNIRVAAATDVKLDWTTFEPVASSHEYSTALTENGVDFLFNNINLTWADNDEPASHGYITYRVKPKTTVGLGDTMHGSAGIFFDFNDPVMTNIASTTVQNTMGVQDLKAEGFVIYPNPASGKITLQLADDSVNAVDAVIADVLGKAVLSSKLNVSGAAADMDISALTSGIYFVTLTSEGKSVTKKLVVK